jgi:pimeloyl-ACP methyl ester carboxylesterase
MTAKQAVKGTARANDVELYYEVRGSGPSLLLIPGSFVDCETFSEVADMLADEFTVITYDRRGYARSPRPARWTSTSIEEQAQDAAELLNTLKLGPAVVVGGSTSGLIGLELALTHSDHVISAVVHEPVLYTTLPPNFVQEQMAEINPIIESAIAAAGPRAGERALLDALSERGLDALDQRVVERWLNNAELAFSLEFPDMIMSYKPKHDALRGLTVPLKVFRAELSLPLNIAAAEWLAAQTGGELGVTPGSHLAFVERPAEFAAALQPYLTVKPAVR